ncbi:hypothetical protein AOR_1_746154 [Paecilomyces variotii No. 5]|uniref:Uncharacterized protein n=1 Tax=Byssochlamys spectabilis (strain No. 5 / NBRC 109023) TaxID=1356009 RepID=V5HTT7_BYSSN|nr:hypothetical protein AOR_1_746154 [Paecilomyces variotii No. 5]
MARQQPRSSVVIPARTSSANAQSVEQPRPRSTGRKDVNSNSKAHKILGTMEMPMDNRWSRMDDRNSAQRQSVMRRGHSSTTRNERNGNLQPPFDPTEHASSPNLRVRASSPLLGQSYRDRGPSFSSVQPLPTKPIHPSESSTSLRDGYNSKDTSATYFNRTPALPTGRSDNKSEKAAESEPAKGNKTPKTPTKESKRKGRPPRIDLSLLFPKPKSSAAPLLSPQRMVDSPSPVSAGSESSMGKAKKSDKFYSFGGRLSRTPPRSSGSWKEKQATVRQLDPIPPLPTAKHTDWYDSPVEKTICCSGGDLTVEIHEREEKKEPEEAPAPVTTDRERERERQNPPKHRFSTMPSMRQPKSSDRTKRMSSNSTLTARSSDTHLSPKPVNNISNTIKSSLETWQSDSRLGSSAGTTGSGAMSKKSGKSSFTDADLQSSSVLCLSSSEDEDEDFDDEVIRHKSSNDATFRSSVATYGEHEPEICTASTVQAAKGPTLTRIQKPALPLREPRQPRRNPSVRRDPSASSYSRSSRLSRPPSGIPTISEPENEETEDEVPMMRSTRSRSNNRRSRVISVTRQEEFLLEAIRQRKGKVTPSLFHEASFASRDSDRNSTLTVNPRESTYNADTSFLRLSPGIPGYPEASAASDPSVADTEKEGSLTHSTNSDTEQRTDNSTVSPRASLIYSDTLPSPSTSRASPITPTLPIHRFSPPPLHPPPSYALPPVPESHSQRRHSRRRTDSSEAIIVNEGEDSKQEDEFPIWALGWNERSSMTIVH